MFKENDYVVYNHKVCKIKTIYNNYIQGKDFYVLNPIDDVSLTIKVPIDNQNNCIRGIISKAEVENIIRQIPLIDTIKNNDKYIENEYKQLLTTGKHEDLIKIIKTAYSRNENRKNAGKKLSEKDGNYFSIAENVLYSEFSIALGISFEETKQYVIDKVTNINNNICE